MNKSTSKDKAKKVKKPTQNNENEEEYQKKNYIQDIKTTIGNNGIVLFISILSILVIYFQYQMELSQRYSVSRDEEKIDYFEVLGLSEGASKNEIKKAYKELSKIWHPDKNPGCTTCSDKFKLIAKAQETLLGQEGGSTVSLFKTPTIYLTANNFHRQVEEGNDYWVIVIYEGQQGNNYNTFIADAWNEVAGNHKNTVKFGAIDILRHPSLIHFIPYKFQYYPNIFTYQNGESEIFENLDLFSVTTLNQFVENNFENKVVTMDGDQLKYVVDQYKSNTNALIKISSIDLSTYFQSKLVIASGKNYIDMRVKDFARHYSNQIEVIQNGLGEFNGFLKALNSNGDYRVYLLYKSVVKQNNEFFSLMKTYPIPYKFDKNSDTSVLYDKSINFVKKLIFPKINKNNYISHCVSHEEEIEVESNKVSLCFLVVEHSEDKTSNEFKLELAASAEQNFSNNVKNNKVSFLYKKDEYFIETAIGILELDRNPKIRHLYNEVQEKNELPTEIKSKEKLVLIVNNTNQKFLFKYFSSPESLSHYLKDIQDPDVFTDMDLGFEYLLNYKLDSIHSILVEEKSINIKKTVLNSIYKQMQGSYIITYILLVLANKYFLEFDTTYFLIGVFGIFTVLNITLRLLDS